MKAFINRRDDGFTIVELLVVLTVIGVLSGIAYVGLNQARSNSVQDSCKAAFQTVDLGVASYQTDHGGYMPGSVQALEPNYVSESTLESYAKNFTVQLGSFTVTSYSLAGKSATLNFSFGYEPQIVVGEKIVVAGVDPANIDGTWQVSSFTSNLDTKVGTVSFAVTSGSTLAPTQAPVGAYLNAVSKPGDPFDIYVFDPNGKRIGTTAPAACSSL
jgi:prepilin-type N-terminal cleavage/methylation domain-containing protein